MQSISDQTKRFVNKPLSRKRGCQVLSCSADLSESTIYCQRRHVCHAHMQAESVQLEGCNSMYRFCFQCSKLQDLTCFDGLKRTCRQRLQKRRDSMCSKKPGAPDCVQPASDPASAAAHVNPPSLTAAQAGEPQLPHGLSGFHFCLSPFNSAAVPGSIELTGGTDISPCSSMGASSLLEAGAAADIDRAAAAAAGQLSCTSTASLPGPGLCTTMTPWDAAAQPSVLGSASGVPPLQSWASVGDAESLGLMLESELTAAALQVVLAGRSTQPLEPKAQQESCRLAAAVVDNSGLFDEPLNCNSHGVPPIMFEEPMPLPPAQLFGLSQQSSNISSLTTLCSQAAGAEMAAPDICAALKPYSPQAAPAWASGHSYGATTHPAVPQAPSGVCGGHVLMLPQQAVPCTASSCSTVPCMPCMALPVAVPAAMSSSAPGQQCFVGYQAGQPLPVLAQQHGMVECLEFLKQQMTMLQARVEMLRHQLRY